jgi:hypothetical protein
VRYKSLEQISDARLKKNVAPLEQGLALVTQLRGLTYEWKEDGREGTRLGFIAQEVEEILPEVVAAGSDGMKAVSYQELTPLLVEAVKEQQTMLTDLKKRVASLETLERRVQRLEQALELANPRQ